MNAAGRDTRVAERDVVVVGGGTLGAFAAWRLARAGRHVTLLDDSPRLGADGRRTEIAGFEVDLGVSILPNQCPRVSRAWIAAMGGRHRYVPLLHRARVGRHDGLARDELGRVMAFGDRLRSVVEAMRRSAWPIVTLADAVREEFGDTAWQRIYRNHYDALFGRPCDGLDRANRHVGSESGQRPTRSLARAIAWLFSGPGSVPSVRQLGPASSWPGPNHDPEDVSSVVGLYPSHGCNAGFLDALEHELESSEVRIESAAECEAIDLDGGRVRRVRAGGRWFAADDFVFVRASDMLFDAVGVKVEVPSTRALAQVTLVVSHPIPDRLWDDHYGEGVVVRTAYPQRFQAIEPGEHNVLACETYHDADVVGEIERDPAALVARVASELVSTGAIPTTAFVVDARVDIVRDAVSGFRVGYFDRLAAGVASVRERLPNVWFAGVAGPTAPVDPSTGALASILDLTERLACSEPMAPARDASARPARPAATVGSN